MRSLELKYIAQYENKSWVIRDNSYIVITWEGDEFLDEKGEDIIPKLATEVFMKVKVGDYLDIIAAEMENKLGVQEYIKDLECNLNSIISFKLNCIKPEDMLKNHLVFLIARTDVILLK